MIGKKNSFKFYWIGRFRYKFSEHLINFYEQKVPKNSMKTLPKKTDNQYDSDVNQIDWSIRYSFGLGNYATIFDYMINIHSINENFKR